MLACLLALVLPVADGAETFEGLSFYLGDPHAHTGVSGDAASTDMGEGVCKGRCGAVEDLIDTAKGNGLDWLAVTDHVNGNWAPDDLPFMIVQGMLLAADDPQGGFITLPAAELWFMNSEGLLGHKNLYLGASNDELRGIGLEDMRFSGELIRIGGCSNIWDWVEDVGDAWGEVMLIAHHPGMPDTMGTTWRCHRGERAARLSPAVEIYSRHGNSVYCPEDYDPLWQGCEADNVATAAMDPDGHALRMGFMAGTDSHDTLPGEVCGVDQVREHPYGGGLTVAVIDEGTPFRRDTLFQAIKHSSVYATSGPLLPAVVEYSVDGTVLGGMGDVLDVPDGEPLVVELRVPKKDADPITMVELMTTAGAHGMAEDDPGVYRIELPHDEVTTWMFPRIQLDGEAWYGEPCPDGGGGRRELIWLSPSYTTERGFGDTAPPPDSGEPEDSSEPDGPGDGGTCRGGCAWGGAGPAVGLVLVVLGMMGLRRRRDQA